MLLKLLLPVPPSPSSVPVPEINSASDFWGPFNSGLKPLLRKRWSAGHRTAPHGCQGRVRGPEMPCVGVVLTDHMFDQKRSHCKDQVVQLRKHGKIPPFTIFSSFYASPALPCPTEAWRESPMSRHAQGSPSWQAEWKPDVWQLQPTWHWNFSMWLPRYISYHLSDRWRDQHL